MSASSIDLNFRPRSYFWPLSAEKHLLSTVRGEARRQAVQAAIDANDLDALSDFCAKSTLSPEERQAFGRMHPSFMGGEYLPGLKEEEIEIARINVDSTTSDVTSVYARRTPKGICYRVVDEYEGDTPTGTTRRFSKLPLTLGDLVDFFLSRWRLDKVLDMNELDEEESQDFVHPSSAFYPGFASVIREKIHAWRSVEEEAEDES